MWLKTKKGESSSTRVVRRSWGRRGVAPLIIWGAVIAATSAIGYIGYATGNSAIASWSKLIFNVILTIVALFISFWVSIYFQNAPKLVKYGVWVLTLLMMFGMIVPWFISANMYCDPKTGILYEGFAPNVIRLKSESATRVPISGTFEKNIKFDTFGSFVIKDANGNVFVAAPSIGNNSDMTQLFKFYVDEEGAISQKMSWSSSVKFTIVRNEDKKDIYTDGRCYLLEGESDIDIMNGKPIMDIFYDIKKNSENSVIISGRWTDRSQGFFSTLLPWQVVNYSKECPMVDASDLKLGFSSGQESTERLGELGIPVAEQFDAYVAAKYVDVETVVQGTGISNQEERFNQLVADKTLNEVGPQNGTIQRSCDKNDKGQLNTTIANIPLGIEPMLFFLGLIALVSALRFMHII
jgi:hypothetical protein